MKKKCLLGMFFLGAALLLTVGVRAGIREAGVEATAWEGRGMEEPTYVPGEILVKWKDWVDGFEVQRAHSRRGARVVSTFYATHRRERTIQQVRIREGQTVEEALREYRRDPLVAHAQPNYLFRMQAVPPLPNDPRFGELWGLHNTGQVVDGMIGTPDADIDAPEAWGITTGSPDIIIAVIDTGVNYNHPELTGNMWINTAELTGVAGVDDDGNGFIDDIRGWDFFDNDNSPMDFNTHGTYIAGTIAAQGNNNAGITGVMWDAQIMALKVSGVEVLGIPLNVILDAINYAVTEGAHIINASWGGTGGTDLPGDALRDAIEAAGTAGVLFVAAAGNGGIDGIGDDNDATVPDVTPIFPASYSLDNIISVAATNRHDALTLFSNFGATSVDVAAPGVSILSTIPTFSYGTQVILYNSGGFDADTLGALPSGWVNMGPNNTWAVTDIYSLSSPHSFADNPGVNYINDLVSTATLTYRNTPVAYTHKDNRYQFTFDIRHDLAASDLFNVVISRNTITWSHYDWFGGSSGGVFAPRAFDLTFPVELFRATGVYLGFGIDSDAIITGEGVYIDNLKLIRKPILIDSYDPTNSHLFYSSAWGTSMAAPHVAGLAGLLLSRSPYLTVGQLKELIIAGVDPQAGLAGKMVSGGRINAYGSLTIPTVVITSTAPDPTNVSPIPMTAIFSEAVTNFVAADITVTNGAVTTGSFTPVPGGAIYNFTVTPGIDGLVSVDIAAGVATDTANLNIAATTFSITFDGTPPAVGIDAVPALTNVAIQTITGTMEVGATVALTSTTVGTTFTDFVQDTAAGNWSATINLVEGTNNITATATDAAGNKGTATATIVLDTIAPAITIATVTTPTNIITQAISGTMEVGATVALTSTTIGTTFTDFVQDTAAGNWSATINLVEGTNNITATATDAAGNKGTAIETITFVSALRVTPDPSLDFPGVFVGDFRELDFTVTNTGTDILTGSAFLPVGSPFSIVAGSPFSLGAGASAPVTVRFSPAAGPFSDIVAFTSNSGDLTRGVSGVGVVPGDPILCVTPASLDFGEVIVEGYRDLDFTIKNTGGGTLTVDTISVLPPFTIILPPVVPFSLAGGLSTTVTVRFSPTAPPGPDSGMVVFTSNVGNENRGVSGVGVQPVLSVTPASLDFSTVMVGESKDLFFTVTNTGCGTLTVSAISVPLPFSIVSPSDFSLTAGETEWVLVRFSPTATGTFSRNVTFTSNGGNENRGVSGVGVLPVLSVTPVTPPPLHFGNVTVGDFLDSPFTVTNTGTGTLTGSAFVDAPFSIIGESSFNLTAGAYTLILVRFSPTATGTFSRNVTFASNVGNESRSVSGTGTDPSPVLSVTPMTPLDFGGVIIGSPRDLNFTVKNIGGGTLTGNAIVPEGPFNIVLPDTFSLGGGLSTTVTVRFSPIAPPGPANEIVSFISNGGNPTRSVSGTGVAINNPALFVTPASKDFGEVIVGESLSLSLAFTVTNTGGGTLTGSATASAPFSIAVGSPFSLEAGLSTTVTVKFNPTATGTAPGTVSFTSNGGNLTRDVSGTGTDPLLVLSVTPVTSLDFGNVPVGVLGGFSDLDFTLTNTGDGTLEGHAIVAAPFSIVGGSSFSLIAGASTTVTVRFSPTTTGIVPGTVTFISNGGNIMRDVSGTGVAIGVPAISVTPAYLDFCEVIIRQPKDKNFTITNTGTVPLTGSAIVAAPFSIVGGSSFVNISAGQSTTVTVRFNPTATGTAPGTVSFASNGGNPDRGVSGVGVQPVLSVTPATPPSLDFGNVPVGKSLDLGFTVTNDGGGTLTGEAIVSAPFNIVSGSDFSLEEGLSTLVLVRFSPTDPVSVLGTVSFTSIGGNLDRGVSGTGVAVVDPAISVTPAYLDFGSAATGESLDLDFTVTNTGGDTLTGNATVVAAAFSIYAVDGVGGVNNFSLAAGQDATVTVRFNPATAGNFPGTVSFTSIGGNLDRGVSGTDVAAVDPALSVTPAYWNFGNITVWQPRNFTFTVTNTGGGTLTGEAIVSAPFSIIGESSYSLGAGASALITVRFRPTAPGTAGGVVTFSGSNLKRGVIGTGVLRVFGEPPPMENGCFIATAAFGTPLAEEIEVLSRLRDEYLLTNELGQRFVALYERHSPALAEFISEREWAKRLVRVVLWPIVRIAEFIVGEE